MAKSFQHHCIVFSFFSTLFLSTSLYALPLPPRVTAWGFLGTDTLARGDAMAALFGNDEQILWADAQGKYGENNTAMAGLGSGYRQVYNDERVLGAYVFMDYTHSPRGNSFWVASPGIESMGNIWDFRVNAYIPVSKQNKKAGIAVGNEIGNNQSVVFTNHQQYDRLFNLKEIVGPGLDAEIGHTFAALGHVRAYVGGYYFHPSSGSSIQGMSGRLEYPVRPHLAITASYSHDNLVHNTGLLGLQLTLGGNSQQTYPNHAEERMLDPISRNLGTQYNGTGIPIDKKAFAGSLILVRDHIYFFKANGGSVFEPANGSANCTFEHPCIGTSFTQSTVNDINSFAPGTNFYFTPGSYSLPNVVGGLILNGGQSMFGRTADYTLAAQNDDRALFLGGISLLQGNNRLDSIRLLNSVTDNTGVGSIATALNIQNAPNVVIFNSGIHAVVTETGDLSSDNFSSGIYANNSQISIENSIVSASSIVTGNNLFVGVNAATGIGGNTTTGTANLTGNTFNIVNSIISGTARVEGNNTFANYASGIGGNTALGNASFTDNTFNILNSHINGTARVLGENGGFFAENFSTGIGGNYGNFDVFGDASFISNNFIITNSNIAGIATIGADNTGFNYVTGIGGNVKDFIGNNINITASNISGTGTINGSNALENFVTGIGGNFGQFTNNTISLLFSNVRAIAAEAGINSFTNYAAGLGGNGGTAPSDFINNNIAIVSSSITALASTGDENTFENFASGIGSNSDVPGFGNFSNNNINIYGSIISSNTFIRGNNTGPDAINQSIGINMNGGGNLVNINNSFVNVLAQIIGDNTGTNIATGLNADASSTINISNSTVNVTGKSNGNNVVAGRTGAGMYNIINTLFNVLTF